MAKKGIRPYGPGKYGKIIDGYAHDVALDGGLDEEESYPDTMRTNPNPSDLAAAVEALADEYLGRFGIVSIADKHDIRAPRIVVIVDGDTTPANAHVPHYYRGFPVDIVPGSGVLPLLGQPTS